MVLFKNRVRSLIEKRIMKRLISIMIRNLHHIPYGWFKLRLYAGHPDKYSANQRHALMREFAKWMVDGGRITLKTYGTEYIPQGNGFMIFSNHQGLFDGFAIAHALETPFSTVYKKELDKVPFVKHIFSCVKAIALDRDDVRQGLEVINRVANEVKEGRNFLIFPEGTRSKNGNQLSDFKSGCLKSATKAKCPILPVVLFDSYKAFDTNSNERITVQVHFLKPLYYEDYKDMKAVQIADTIKGFIEKTIENNTSRTTGDYLQNRAAVF